MKKLMLVSAALCSAFAFGAKIVSIDVKSTDAAQVNAGDVLARCKVKVGDTYDAEACARDVRALRDAHEFDEIVLDAQETAGGIAITYNIARKKRFAGPLNVKGNDYWSASKIASFAELQDGFAYGSSDIAAAVKRIEREYHKKFYSDVAITPVVTPVEGNPDAVTITMEINEGERRKISEFTFVGNEQVEASDLRAAFDDMPWWNPMGWFSETPWGAQEFAEARDKVLNLYRDRGYLDAECSLPERIERVDGKVNMCFTVKEGAQYKVGRISVEGVKEYPEDAVLGANTTLKTGDIAGLKAMNDAAHQIEVFCGSGKKALTDTHVSIKRIPTEQEDVVDLIMSVEEGAPVTINNILVRGNDYTKDKVIRREIALSPGDPMLADKAERSKTRLENLRYFSRVQYYLEKTGEKDAEGREKRDLVYEVEERNTGNFMIGIGASSVDSVYGTVELSESNFDLFNPWRFRGAGQKGRISIMAGPRIQNYEASVTEPYFLGHQLELTVEAYRRQRWFDDYDVIRNGASASIAYPVKFWPTWGAFGRLGMRISAEYVQFDDVSNSKYYNPVTEDDEWRAFKEEEDQFDNSWEIPLRIFWEDDTRDRFLFPTRGHKVNIYGDVVGGDNEFWRAGFSCRQYLTVWKRFSHVLMIGLRGETVDTFSGDLPIYDRLFLGGPRSIRGVDYREIAPRIYRREGKKGHHAAWGGKTSWCMNIEYSVPVFKMLRVAAFTDLGSVGEDEWDFDQDMFCWSVGFGFRLDIESFPIRVDFAVPVKKPDDDIDKKFFSFTVGFDF